jgi:CheY-like chemotaxis protein
LLLVDDDLDLRELLAHALRALCEVELAADGASALARLRTSGGLQPIDLVVTDLTMPRLDGLGLLDAIRSDKRLCKLPVVLISALAQPARAAVLARRAQDYLVKPFPVRELAQRVCDQLWRLRRQGRRPLSRPQRRLNGSAVSTASAVSALALQSIS